MAVLAKPHNQAIVIPAKDKDKFVAKSKESDAFNRMIERSSRFSSKVHFSGVSVKNGKD